MVKRDELVKFIHQTIGEELIEKGLQKDEVANGVQFSGSKDVEKVVLGVSSNEDFLKEAVKSGGQFCIFHHGYDPRVWKSRIPTYSQKRLKVIIKNNLTIMGFHYCLDAHPEFGNNATIIKKLGAKIDKPFWEEWGYTAKFSTPQEVNKLSKKCAEIFEHDIFAVLSGPKKIKTIGVVSGGAKPYAQNIAEMEQKDVELFITGETSESIPHKMKESGINYFAGGHYATEVFGVQELGKKIKEYYKDKLEVEFIDIPNEI
ncbi:MAG: Nif3-like dinuclear metal center hexameric protein [Patescibacteria group bacterium]|nr:Nif3-like dinuclear metal center hexameric protein [Patescibacteria group bacterium]